MIDDDVNARTVHRKCRPPAFQEFGPGFKVRHLYEEDTRWHCGDCGKVWILWWSRGSDGRRGGGYSPSGLRWREETAWERRKRLGLTWRQRLRRRLLTTR